MTLSLIDNVTSDVIPISRLPALIGRASEADVLLDDERIGNLQRMVDRTWLGLVLWDRRAVISSFVCPCGPRPLVGPP